MNANAESFLSLPHYNAYIVRFWQDCANAPWRASAQSVRTREKVYFADLESLFIFLREQAIAAQRVER